MGKYFWKYIGIFALVMGCTDQESVVVEPTNGHVEDATSETLSPDVRFDAEQAMDAVLQSPMDMGFTRDEGGPNVRDADAARQDAAVLDKNDSSIDSALDANSTCIVDTDECARLSAHWSGSATRFPIVLVHGFMGWDRRWWLEYFYDIPDTLHDAGYSVFAAAMDPIASSEVRSRQLLDFVEAVLRCSCAEKVNLIGHSQGGLDARRLLGPLDKAEYVASITTISSPHRGFQLADDVLANRGLGPVFLDALAVMTATLFLGEAEQEADLRATLGSMTIEGRTAYNERWPDPPEVPIYSYAGFTGLLSDGQPECAAGERPAPSRGDIVEPALIGLYGFLGGPSVANDGVVPVAPCIWGRFLGCIAADHWDQIGQAAGLTDRFNFRDFYLEHAAFLRNEGH